MSLLLWSIIPAAFIGPGTVTTCAKAGASFGMALLWSLLFSIGATLILQEAAARITIGSGKSPGEIISILFKGQKSCYIKHLLFGSIAFGCAAYQTGNILGAISGIALLTNIHQAWLVAGFGVIAGSLLWGGNIRLISNILAGVVFLMGLLFFAVALQKPPDLQDVLSSFLPPALPSGSELIAIGLIGTTVVPYNLFLAGRLSEGQKLGEMRWGLSWAIVMGGLVSLAVLLTGTQVSGPFSFESLAQTLSGSLGPWARTFFGLGLFAAGASSSVTAPLAAALTGQAIYGNNEGSWHARSFNFRSVWTIVLGIGIFFGMLGLKPVPAIITAQAINGILLPLAAVFLWKAVNDSRILPEKFLNSRLLNLATGMVTGIVVLLGFFNLWKVVSG